MKKFYPALFALLLLAGSCSKEKKTTEIPSSEKYYGEPYRPQYHFSPDSMWMNDPNGMVYFDGEYHLFYQYYPDSTVWGPMHWGHAVSKDMVNWEHLPIALYPDEKGYIFSGSAVYDENNTSGLGTSENPPLVAIFTYHDPKGEKEGSVTYQSQAIAYSTDRGRTWEKYEGNPVVPNPGIRDFRDPKVQWHKESSKWIMSFAAYDRIKFYSSPDLKTWTFMSEFGENSGSHGGVWECPDLIRMNIEGKEKWVLLVSINPGGLNGGSATQYFIGDFDGNTFTNNYPEGKTRWLDYGRDDYAGVTWSNGPDDRVLFLGWMSNWNYGQQVPTSPWRSAMTLPRTLSLENVGEEMLVASQPVKEVSQLVVNAKDVPSGYLSPEGLEIPLSSDLQYLNLEIDLGESDYLVYSLTNETGEHVDLEYYVSEKRFTFNRDDSGLKDFSDTFLGDQTAPRFESGNMTMEIYIDRSSIEMFIDGGKTTITNLVFPSTPYTRLLIKADAKAQLVSGSKGEMKSIWK